MKTSTLVTRVGNVLFSHFAPPHPRAMLTKHFDLTQVCIWLFSNIERGNGGAGTYSIGITVMSSCFCHFPTQFVQGCGYCSVCLWVKRIRRHLNKLTLLLKIFNFETKTYTSKRFCWTNFEQNRGWIRSFMSFYKCFYKTFRCMETFLRPSFQGTNSCVMFCVLHTDCSENFQ